jgi:hypothetical protein
VSGETCRGSIPALPPPPSRDTIASARSYNRGVIGVSPSISCGAWLFAVVPAILAAVVSAETAASAPSAATRQAGTAVTYRDAVGEDALAPDISSIVVAAGTPWELSFRVNIPNRQTLTDDMRLRIWLDTDHDLTTGLRAENVLGVDYFILVDRWELGLGVARLFACTESVCRGGPLVRSSYAAGGSFSVSVAELGIERRQRLRFRIESSSGWVFDPVKGYDSTNVHADAAPDQGRFWTFDMRPLVVKSFDATPRTPHAGARFVLRMSAIRTATGRATAGKLGCMFSIAGAQLRPSKSAFGVGGAVCVFDIPRTAKTKRFRSSIVISIRGDRVRRSIAGTIS